MTAFVKETNLRDETLKNEVGFVTKRTPSEVFMTDLKPLLTTQTPPASDDEISSSLLHLREKLMAQGHDTASKAVEEFRPLISYPSVYLPFFEVS
jgi:hypothetical protein